jgi:hypothetical protein
MFDAASLFWAEAIIASTRQARAKRKGPKLRSRARIAVDRSISRQRGIPGSRKLAR